MGWPARLKTDAFFRALFSFWARLTALCTVYITMLVRSVLLRHTQWTSRLIYFIPLRDEGCPAARAAKMVRRNFPASSASPWRDLPSLAPRQRLPPRLFAGPRG